MESADDGAMSQARARLGEVPLRLLFERVAVPMARPGTRGAWLGSWRLMAAGGVQLEVPDTPANTAAFGKVLHRSEPGPFPQVRVVGLAECGTHAVVAARIGSLHEGERDLATGLLGACEAGMLVLADRGFYSLALWTAAASTGADLLWRVSASVDLPVVEVLPDGSYRSVLADVIARQRHRRHLRAGRADSMLEGLPVRVIEYQISDRGGSGEMFCLITTILGAERASAAELAWAYSQRWEFEVALAEIETSQRGPHRILRSKSPEMVRQEIWALLATHYAIRDLMRQAADDVDLDPDRMSFLRSLRVVRRHLVNQAGFSP